MATYSLDEVMSEGGKKTYSLDDVMGETAKQPAQAKQPTLSEFTSQQVGRSVQQLKDTAGGLVRGAGSIGTTMLYPFDKAMDVIKGNRFEQNVARRKSLDPGLAMLVGSDPSSVRYQAGKLASEIGGTMGAGGALAKGVQAIAPGAVALPNALRTGGMVAGTTPGAANMATRMLGGGITGATMAGMVDPGQAKTGAAVGALMPTAMMAAGKVGQAIGRTIGGPATDDATRSAVGSARQSGYVIPPSQARPTLVNRALEGFSGKISTAQNASARNQAVTNRMVAAEIGLPTDVPITPETLGAVRAQAGKAYEAVRSAGTINPGPGYIQALDDITANARKAAQGFPNAKPNPLIAEIDSLKSPSFDADSAVSKISSLRSDADAAYASGNKELGKALKSGADVLEDAIDQHLAQIGAPSDMLNGFRESRKLIAKTYTVQKALNPTTGTINAQKLAGELTKGKPLSGGIRSAAEFAQRFPKAAQPIEKMGSLPQVSPLDFGALGTISALTSNPLLMAGVLARPAARGAVLSGAVQNRLAQPQGQMMQGLLSNPELQQLLYRSAPVISAR